MHTEGYRQHLTHFEVQGGTCHVTWRLHREQAPLSPDERTVVLEILRRAPEFGCAWHAAIVMDDHVHALFSPGDTKPSKGFVASWKGASSRIITRDFRRRPALWQPEFYQRWIAYSGHIEICAQYIRANPERRWSGIRDYPWVLP